MTQQSDRLRKPNEEEWFGDTNDPRFLEWLSKLPKSKTHYKDEYAPPGECIRCFAVKNSQTHIKGTRGYMHEYENPADISPEGLDPGDDEPMTYE